MKDTLPDIRGSFEAEGISIREWALARGFNPRTVYAVLRGECKATRGVSHRIAVALGVKKEPNIKRLAS